MPDPKIAIIGGGIAGLTLARALHRGGVPFKVYEKDESRHSRKQGGPVNVHYDRGERALRALGVFDRYDEELISPGCEVTTLGDETGNCFLHHSRLVPDDLPALDSNAPLADRLALRQLLLDSIPTESVIWGSKLQDIAVDGTQYDLAFADGTIEKGIDLVVGADGAWSKVRSMVTDVKPYYSGVSYMETEFSDVLNAPPEILEYVERGSYYYIGPHTCLVLQRNGNKSIWVYAMLEKPETWAKEHGFDLTDIRGSKEEFIRKDWQGWSDNLKAAILKSDRELIPRPLYMLPVGHDWRPRQGITLIGDAAHLMTPFGGAGANTALEDGLELGEFIIGARRRYNWLYQDTEKFSDPKGLAGAVLKYETAMYPRAKAEAARTDFNKGLFFSDNAIEKFRALYQVPEAIALANLSLNRESTSRLT
ncbi:hypothetical protein F5884DRAFT_788664 [Xylogone sp. PMI_703]|nr:hypothetical protein F5884DRAFT_788664 [Xylogone sp. PMI_703]